MLKLKLFGNNVFREAARYQNDNYLIHLNDVKKAYLTEAGEFLALKNVNLTIGKGEFVGVIGKSGSGKSTLINMITGIDRPTNGEIFVDGIPIHSLNEGEVAKWRGRNLGIVFQFFQLLPILTVAENVMLPMDFCNMYSPSKRRQRALEVLDLVGVAAHANKLPGQLSGGEQQRVAIARALANDPPIVMADEPTGNLDSKTAAIIFSLFDELVSGGKTIVMVTHDKDQARRVTRTIVIADGEIIEQYLSQAFPSLSQEQLILLTSQLQSQKFSPGSLIIKKGDAAEKLYIVTRGHVDVIRTTPDGKEQMVAQIAAPHYFGEAEIINGSASPVTFRAGPEGEIETAALPKEIFKKLLNDSETTRQEIVQLARQRAGEYHRTNGVDKS